MATAKKKISELTATTTLAGADTFVVVQSGVTKKITALNVGVSAPTVSTLMARDASGRTQAVDPSVGSDVATKSYADSAAGVAGSFVVGATIDNVTSFGQTYADAAGVTPVDGIGGSPALTAATNATTPLSGTKDWLITKPASNVQGQGWSVDFTIDRASLGQPIQITFPYKNSAANDDFQLFVYDVTNAALIPVSDQYLKNCTTALQHLAVFYPSTSLSYRLIIHYKGTDTTAFAFYLDNIVVARQQTIQGPIVSDEIAYTPTFQGFGTPTGVNFKWRRVGNKMQIRGTLTAGTTTAVEAQIGLPAVGVNTPSDLPTLSEIGHWARGASTSVGAGGGILVEASKSYLTIGQQAGGTSSLTKNVGNAVSTGEVISLFAEVPIAQWSVSTSYLGMNDPFCLSNTEATINTNGVIGKTYQGWDGAAILANTANTFYDMTPQRALLPNETYLAEVYSKIDGNWVPVEKAYIPSINVIIQQTRGAQATNGSASGIYIAKNAAGQVRIYFSGGLVSTPLTAGADGVQAFVTWATMIAAADGFTRWRVRIGKSTGMAEVAPKIRASYFIASFTFTTANVTPLNPTTKEFDSSLTVSNGVFTAQRSGVVRVTVTLLGVSTFSNFAIFKNGSQFRIVGTTSASFYTTVSQLVPVNVGDTVDVRGITSGMVVSNASLQFELDA